MSDSFDKSPKSPKMYKESTLYSPENLERSLKKDKNLEKGIDTSRPSANVLRFGDQLTTYE